MANKKHRIYFHVFPWAKTRWVIEEQLTTIRNSGILEVADLVVCVVSTRFSGHVELPDWVENRCEVEHNGTEWPTLLLAQQWAKNNPLPDMYTLYIHTKGAIKSRMHGCNHTWRQFMMYFLVEKFMEAFAVLDENPEIDALGCNLKNKQPRGKYKRSGQGPFDLWHFSGNFWWARNSGLIDLPIAGSDEARNIDTWQGHKPRLAAERWIGELGSDRLHQIHRAKVNINNVPYTREMYAD